MKRRNRVTVMLLGVSVVCLTVMTACSHEAIFGKSSPPAAVQQPPIYPGATEGVVENTGAIDSKTITFKTSAGPKDVQEYYTDILTRDGWVLHYVPQPETPYSLYFSWRDAAHNPGYTLELVINQNGANDTSVKLKVVTYPQL